MQIRAGNRQDEAIIRTIVFQALQEHGIEADLEGRDNDLRNVEHNYFWHNGLCLVAESDGQVIGVLAGRQSPADESVLELSRLAVVGGARRRGAGRKLIATMLFFARNMEYKKIVLAVPGLPENPADPEVLTRLGFVQDEATKDWTYSLSKQTTN